MESVSVCRTMRGERYGSRARDQRRVERLSLPVARRSRDRTFPDGVYSPRVTRSRSAAKRTISRHRCARSRRARAATLHVPRVKLENLKIIVRRLYTRAVSRSRAAVARKRSLLSCNFRHVTGLRGNRARSLSVRANSRPRCRSGSRRSRRARAGRLYRRRSSEGTESAGRARGY